MNPTYDKADNLSFVRTCVLNYRSSAFIQLHVKVHRIRMQQKFRFGL